MLCPNLEFVDMHNYPSKAIDGQKINPAVGVYSKNSGRTSLHDIDQVEIMTELKFDDRCDPFTDDGPEGNFKRNTTQARETLARMAIYAATQQKAQSRTHVFSVLVFPTSIRLFRWDNTGLMVTRRLAIDDLLVLTFFQKFDRATPTQRGCHTTSSATGKKEFTSPSRRSKNAVYVVTETTRPTGKHRTPLA